MTAAESATIAEAMHALSQPLTALEIGLEVGLRQDRTVEQLRGRMENLLDVVQAMHRQLEELRAKQDVAF